MKKPNGPTRPMKELDVSYSHDEVLAATGPALAQIFKDLDEGKITYIQLLAIGRATISAAMYLASYGVNEEVTEKLTEIVTEEFVSILHQALCKAGTWTREEYFAHITPEKIEKARHRIKRVTDLEAEDELKQLALEKERVALGVPSEDECDCAVCQMRKEIAKGATPQDLLKTLMKATGAEVTIIKMGPDGAEELPVKDGQTIGEVVAAAIKESGMPADIVAVPVDPNQVKH
jgi:hypothetical protein